MHVRASGRLAVSAAVTTVAAVLVWYVPSIAGTSWTSVGEAFSGVPLTTIAVLTAVWVAGLTCNSLALAASMPGLTTRRALTLSLTGSAVANVLPLGGAAGVGLNYTMARRWGFSAPSFGAYTVTTNVCDVASKLTVVAVAGVILVLDGGAAVFEGGATTWLSLLVVLPVAATLLLRQANAARLGRVLDRISGALSGVAGRTLAPCLQDRLPEMARLTTTVIRQRWPRLILGTFGYAGLQALLLWQCMHVAGLDLDARTLAGALAADRLLTLLPFTPGGVGFVEGGMAAALTMLGAAGGPVAAGVLLYRGFTYLAEIPVGGVMGLFWLARQRRTERSTPVPPVVAPAAVAPAVVAPVVVPAGDVRR